MSQTLEELGIDKLTTTERLELIGLLWDSISDRELAPSVPDWHLRELERRRGEAEANPGAGIPWEEVKASLNRSS